MKEAKQKTAAGRRSERSGAPTSGSGSRSRSARGGLAPDKYLTQDEQRRLIRHVRERADLARARGSRRGVVDEAIIATLLGAGLRPMELCALQFRDLPASHGKAVLFVRTGKGGVSRTVDVGPDLCRRLNRFVKLYRPRAKATATVFINERGRPFDYFNVWWRVRAIGRAAGIADLYPYRLRHTYATRLYNVEKDLRFVQDQLGHASPTTTAIYAKTDQPDRRRQVEAFEALSLAATSPATGRKNRNG